MWTEWVGRSLGRYHIEELIGRGAMGVVFRARDPDLQRTVAIKILYPNLTADEELVERFRLEARTAANLHHRNIVGIYDVGYAEDLYYLVMEYIDGSSLSRIIEQEGALAVPQVLDVGGQVASALDYIHRHRLVHRDIKSTNIMIDQEGRAVLTDFGLVWSSKGSALTAEGKIIGTPQYLAPEQISGGEIGLWTDVYALGVVVFRMLTGRYPFDANVPAAFLFQVLWQPPPAVRTLRTDLPEAMDKVLNRVLAKEPADRYPSGAAFVADLQYALDGGEITAAEVVGPAQPRVSVLSTVRSLPSWVWATLGVLLLLATGLPFLLGSGILSTHPAATATRPVVAVLTTSSPTPTVLLPQETPSPTPTEVMVLPTPSEPASPTQPAPTVTVQVLPTETPAPTDTPLPTEVPVPTSTPVPTRVIQPTVPPPTPVPPTPVPPTPVPPTQPPPTQPPPTQPPPTDTPVPPTDTPVPPTDTPVPTSTLPPDPTNTPPGLAGADLSAVSRLLGQLAGERIRTLESP